MTTDATIFLVEDDAIDAEWVDRLLRRHLPGCELVVARDGDEALAMLLGKDAPQIHPDVILLDLNLPRVSGLEVLAELRADSRFADIPVLILSTSDEARDRAVASASDANAYLVKGQLGDKGKLVADEILRYLPGPRRLDIALATADDALAGRIAALLGDDVRLTRATRASELMKLLARSEPACLIVDDALPDADSASVLARLSLADSSGVVPVVVIALADDFQLASESVADAYLSESELTRNGLRLAIGAATERFRLRRELARQRDAFRGFAVQAAHDLRGPLRRIRQFADLLARDHGEQLGESPQRWLGFIADNSARLDELVARLLDYAAAGSRAQRTEEVDLGQIVVEARHGCEQEIEETGAVIEVGALPVVRGDRARLRQLFQNLLQNALRYRRRAPQIAIEATHRGDHWLFEVADNGLGMEPRVASRAFEPLYSHQPEESTRGVGLGLALVETIVSQHGGRVWVDSTPGIGSRFYFTLPCDPS